MKTNKLINIKDKLPERCEEVLLYIPNLYGFVVGELDYHGHDEEQKYWRVEVRSMWIDKESRADSSFSSDVKFEEVTHWMQLPEAPG